MLKQYGKILKTRSKLRKLGFNYENFKTISVKFRENF